MSLLNSKNIIALGIIVFLAMSFWSLSSMSMDTNGHMVNCPFMDSLSGFCQMSVSEHISQWQQFFAMTKEKNLVLSLFFLMAVILVGLFTHSKFKDETQYQKFRNYLYRYRPELKLFDHLLLAFSQGIIHSKVYA